MRSLLDLGVDAEIHVAVNGGVIMSDGQTFRGGEEVCKVAGGGGNCIDRQGFVVILRDLILGHIVEVVGKVLFGGGGVCINGGTGGLDGLDLVFVLCTAFYTAMAGIMLGQAGSVAIFRGRGLAGSSRRSGGSCSCCAIVGVARLVRSPVDVP